MTTVSRSRSVKEAKKARWTLLTFDVELAHEVCLSVARVELGVILAGFPDLQLVGEVDDHPGVVLEQVGLHGVGPVKPEHLVLQYHPAKQRVATNQCKGLQNH